MKRVAAIAIACVVAVATGAQEFSWDSMVEAGMDAVDRQLSAHGYELDREALSSVPRWEDAVRFWASIQQALETQSIDDLAWLKPEVEAAVAFLDPYEAAQPYVAWMRQKLDYFEVADEAAAAVPEAAHRPPVAKAPPPFILPARDSRLPPPPAVKKELGRRARAAETWAKKVQSRPAPKGSAELAAELRPIFEEEGVPGALVWLAEVESSFNPKARSPVGAAGLYQFMRPSAQRFGLRVENPDERLVPRKSARAAAQYLRLLHKRFGAWDLALAAYNAGEGRVSRTLKAAGATTFDAIADDLPAETQMYVPKFAAVLKAREGIDLGSLPAPTAR